MKDRDPNLISSAALSVSVSLLELCLHLLSCGRPAKPRAGLLGRGTQRANNVL
jgi:hypothetical protein